MHVSIQAEIESRVIGVIRRELRALDRAVDARTRLDQLGADSLTLVKLTLTFEEAFDIEIPDEEADRIRTIQDAVTTVERHIRVRRLPEGGSSAPCKAR
jgi:acyl carrier protein